MTQPDELYHKLLAWIETNTDKVSLAQSIALKIKEKNLLNLYRKLPFEITPNSDDFKLTVFLDHPKRGSWDLVILDDEISLTNLDKPDEIYPNRSSLDIFEFIDSFDDEDAKTFSKLQDAVFSRNFTLVNKLLNVELKKYREIVDAEIKSIKKFLSSTENVGLTNPADGSVSYLNRVMGRWDLALLWSPCPFVVVSNPEETTKLQDMIYDFKILEQDSCQLLNNMQKLCVLSDMDVEIRTDSKESEMDASGWVELDDLGIPKIGPLIHAVKINAYSKIESAYRKTLSSNNLIL